MVEYAYTTVTGKIKPLLDKIRTAGVGMSDILCKRPL
jgi:hypothetical protein